LTDQELTQGIVHNKYHIDKNDLAVRTQMSGSLGANFYINQIYK